MGPNGKKIHIPGIGEVGQPDPVNVLIQQMNQLVGLVDMALQVSLRLERGWDVEDIITDMGLQVPQVGGSGRGQQPS